MTVVDYGERPVMKEFKGYPAGAHLLVKNVAHIKLKPTIVTVEGKPEQRNAVSYTGELVKVNPDELVEHIKKVDLSYESSLRKAASTVEPGKRVRGSDREGPEDLPAG